MPFADLLHVSTLTVSTVGADGEPHAAPVYFVATDDLRLYFFSDPASQHAQDFSHDPRAAAALYPECEGWEEIRGLQMRGVLSLVQPGLEWDTAWRHYQEKFPFVTEFQAVVAVNELYVFVPRWIRWIDNRRGFGFKEEWTLT